MSQFPNFLDSEVCRVYLYHYAPAGIIPKRVFSSAHCSVCACPANTQLFPHQYVNACLCSLDSFFFLYYCKAVLLPKWHILLGTAAESSMQLPKCQDPVHHKKKKCILRWQESHPDLTFMEYYLCPFITALRKMLARLEWALYCNKTWFQACVKVLRKCRYIKTSNPQV